MRNVNTWSECYFYCNIFYGLTSVCIFSLKVPTSRKTTEEDLNCSRNSRIVSESAAEGDRMIDHTLRIATGSSVYISLSSPLKLKLLTAVILLESSA